MPAQSIERSWTVVTWLVAHGRSDLDAVVGALRRVEADAIALQSLEESDVEHIADALGVRSAWELSYHPVSRLIPGSGIGLAVLSPHAIDVSQHVVINEHHSTWSKHRRIAQFAVVDRADHSSYAIGHAVGTVAAGAMPGVSAPLVMIRPEQVEHDPGRAVEVPSGATVTNTEVVRPIGNAEPMLTVTFEMPWVQGDSPRTSGEVRRSRFGRRSGRRRDGLGLSTGCRNQRQSGGRQNPARHDNVPFPACLAAPYGHAGYAGYAQGTSKERPRFH